jgi:hypothetical protein
MRINNNMQDTSKCIFHIYIHTYIYLYTLRQAHDCENRLVKQTIKHTYKTTGLGSLYFLR